MDIAIEHGIERWIVVHLELAVELETAVPGEDVGPKLGQADGEIGALRLENLEPLPVAIAVGFAGFGAAGLLGRVEDFERKDG